MKETEITDTLTPPELIIIYLIKKKLEKEKVKKIALNNEYFVRCIKQLRKVKLPKNSIVNTLTSLERKGYIKRTYDNDITNKKGSKNRIIELLKQPEFCNVL